jgi:lactam utilization protein B
MAVHRLATALKTNFLPSEISLIASLDVPLLWMHRHYASDGEIISKGGSAVVKEQAKSLRQFIHLRRGGVVNRVRYSDPH